MPLRINLPPLTRVLLVLIAGTSLVYQAAYYRDPAHKSSRVVTVPWIALVPQASIFYPWVFITSTLAEPNVVTLLIAGATVLFGGKYLERAWGSAEFGKFLLITTLIPNVVATILYILLFAITRAKAQEYASIALS